MLPAVTFAPRAPSPARRASLALATTLALGACGGSPSPEPGEPDLEPVRWHLEKAPQGRSVPLVYTTEECVRTPGEDTGAETAARFERAEIDSSSAAVTITVLLRPADDSGEGEDGAVACGSAPIAVRRMVALPEPIGDRLLRDGSASPPAAVRAPE